MESFQSTPGGGFERCKAEDRTRNKHTRGWLRKTGDLCVHFLFSVPYKIFRKTVFSLPWVTDFTVEECGWSVLSVGSGRPEDGSVGEVLALQAWGPELHSPLPLFAPWPPWCEQFGFIMRSQSGVLFHCRPQTSNTKWPRTKTSETVSQDEPAVPLSELVVSSISNSAGKLTSVCHTADAESAMALSPRTNFNQPEKNV